MASSSSNVVGVHYRVGKKIGEGSFGVIFEGMNLLNSQQVAIKFVCTPLDELDFAVQTRLRSQSADMSSLCRNPGRAMLLSCAMSTEPTRSWLVAVSLARNLE